MKAVKRDYFLYIMLVPFVLWYVLFLYKPMYGLQIAFKDFSLFKGIADSPWVGWKNFQTYFNGPYFYRTLKNTVILSLYELAFAFPAPIILALLLNEVKNKLYKASVQTLTYLPYFISTVVVVGIVTNFLAPSNGLINILLDKIGMGKTYFLVNPEYFRSIYISMEIWQKTGFSAIVYLAALSSINPELYEAAGMDGANKLRQMWHITLPGILPTIMILLILKIGDLLEISYEVIILLYQPATYVTADVIGSYVYRTGLVEAQYDLAAAVGLFNSAVALILVILANYGSKKWTGNGLW